MKGIVARWNALSRRSKIIWSIVALLIIGIVGFLLFGQKAKVSAAVTVKRGTLTQMVTVTGNTTPIGDVSLSFLTSGTITSVPVPVGSTVTAGQVLAKLNTSTLSAQLAGAQANVDAAEARLASLEAGATPQTIAVSQAALNAANQQLANDYVTAYQALITSYANAQDAVRSKLDTYFQNSETAYPRLIFVSNNGIAANAAQTDRPIAGNELLKWQTDLIGLSPASPTASIEAALAKATTHLAVIQQFLSEMSDAAAFATTFPPGSTNTQQSVQASIALSIAEANSAQTSIMSASQAISTQKAALAQAQATFNQTKAGATSYDLAAQQAQVESAQASVDQIQAQINQAIIRSPIAGTVSVQNAKIGQIATPNNPLVTVISKSNLEIDANLPETDIGKVNVDDPVSITFDAFPGEKFTGTVFYIDPAETIISGVVNYKIKVAFTKPDLRIKSGLTANMEITTNTKDNVLILPQFAILENDNGSFVEITDGKTTKQIPVTTGIQDDAGNVEITSGVTEGEQVLNLGLKTGSS